MFQFAAPIRRDQSEKFLDPCAVRHKIFDERSKPAKFRAYLGNENQAYERDSRSHQYKRDNRRSDPRKAPRKLAKFWMPEHYPTTFLDSIDDRVHDISDEKSSDKRRKDSAQIIEQGDSAGAKKHDGNVLENQLNICGRFARHFPGLQLFFHTSPCSEHKKPLPKPI